MEYLLGRDIGNIYGPILKLHAAALPSSIFVKFHDKVSSGSHITQLYKALLIKQLLSFACGLDISVPSRYRIRLVGTGTGKYICPKPFKPFFLRKLRIYGVCPRSGRQIRNAGLDSSRNLLEAYPLLSQSPCFSAYKFRTYALILSKLHCLDPEKGSSFTGEAVHHLILSLIIFCISGPEQSIFRHVTFEAYYDSASSDLISLLHYKRSQLCPLHGTFKIYLLPFLNIKAPAYQSPCILA